MAELRDEKLDFWLANNLNVLLIGPHGVGKTSRVLAAFGRAKLKYKYFSASTMDPWVDFIGIPKEAKDDKGGYLELVLPKELRDDNIDALFFDEFNRSQKKVRNAVMELIQFKSINGRKFNNLKVVWAAINPEDTEEYQVEELDPAQKGRFHVKFNVPSEPSKAYFTQAYNASLANSAVAWWQKLPAEIKKLVDPRTLDYALKMFNLGGDVRDVLPKGCNPGSLLSVLKNGPVDDKLWKFIEDKNTEAARQFLAIENNFTSCKLEFHRSWMEFFLPLIPKEKLSCLFSANNKIREFILESEKKATSKCYNDLIKEIIDANTNNSLIFKIKKAMPSTYFDKHKASKWATTISQLKSAITTTTQHRRAIFDTLVASYPANMSLIEAQDAFLIFMKCVKSTSEKYLKRKTAALCPLAKTLIDNIRCQTISTSGSALLSESEFKKLFTASGMLPFYKHYDYCMDKMKNAGYILF